VTPVIAQADRASWQRQAAAELAVGPASSVLIGQVSGLAAAPQVRQAFTAWRRALGLGECREQPGGGGTSRLHAADRSGGVTVRLTATVFEQEEA
jgi:hypothetical protein